MECVCRVKVPPQVDPFVAVVGVTFPTRKYVRSIYEIDGVDYVSQQDAQIIVGAGAHCFPRLDKYTIDAPNWFPNKTKKNRLWPLSLLLEARALIDGSTKLLGGTRAIEIAAGDG